MGCFNLQQLYQKMQERMSPTNDEEAPLSVKCIYCTRRKRVTQFQQLSKGSHIQLKGENLRLNIPGKRQYAPYTHHAIVKGVRIINDSEAELNLIEFISTPLDSALKIRETFGIKTLKNEDIYLILYSHETHSPDEIIRRAESFVQQCQDTEEIKYSLLTCNCEHFCHWCCTGNENSYQVHNVKDAIKNILQGTANIGGKILRVVLRLIFLSAEDLTKAAAGTLVYLPWGVLSLFALIYLVYCIYCHIKINADKKDGNICSSCCSRLKMDLWLRFAIYAVTQAGGLVLMSTIMAAFASIGVAVGALLLISILSIGTMWLIPRLKNKLCSPFNGKKVRVMTMRNIWQGDVISFRYKGFMHDAIVTAAFPDKTDDKKGRITVVHYSKPKSFGRRKIIEEDLIYDLSKRVLLGHVYDPKLIKAHPPEVVVKRARQRIGETKFGVLSNRSCHFCHWAKVVEDDEDEVEETTQETVEFIYDQELSSLESFSRLQSLHVEHRPGRTHATKTLKTCWAKIPDDIKAGQLIQFKLYWRWHKAVVTNVKYAQDKMSKLSVTVVHYGEKREVTEDTYTFDLNEVDIWIYKYHPVYKFSREDIIRRARARIGEKKYDAFSRRSTHLCEEIVEKGRDPIITHFGDIQPGNAIIFYYWSMKHAAIVTSVNPEESKDNTTGKIGIVHYARQSAFATRTILEEIHPINLNVDHVYKMNFDGCVPYPTSMIIKRAKSRIGEKCFSAFANTSWHFVQWASVVQRAVIVEEVRRRPQSHVDQTPEREEVRKRLLLPKVPEVFQKRKLVPIVQVQAASEKFHPVYVRSWDDLNTGDIIEFTYYWIPHQGIVSEVDAKREKIKVIHYGASHIFAVREVVEDSLNVDFKRENWLVYRTDPRFCHKRRDIVDRARRRLGEADWRSGNRSWDMCLACVFKRRHARSSSK